MSGVRLKSEVRMPMSKIYPDSGASGKARGEIAGSSSGEGIGDGRVELNVVVVIYVGKLTAEPSGPQGCATHLGRVSGGHHIDRRMCQ
jgi:hypothetical protein